MAFNTVTGAEVGIAVLPVPLSNFPWTLSVRRRTVRAFLESIWNISPRGSDVETAADNATGL
jgi:hypothetical protein